MIACWDCRNLESFVQVSGRGDARDLRQRAVQGLAIEPFSRPDARPAGVYCLQCGKAVEADLDQLGLNDGRLDFVVPADFRADVLASELRALRDAEWSSFEIPPSDAQYGPLPDGVHTSLSAALERIGRLPLYTHQSEAIEAALNGRHVVQATSTGSGKSLGFTVPVLNRLLNDADATALMVFPLRALTNDQLTAMARLGVDADPWVSPSSFDLALDGGPSRLRVTRYDGATMDYERPVARRAARLIISTPDMLHVSILRKGLDTYRDGSGWRRFLGGLSFVVIDEIHSYQGVFGSNVAHVFRRLRRLCERLGASPQFLAASATIGNPVELAERLTGLSPFHLVDGDGSARRARTVLVCNPPIRETATAVKAQATKKGRAEGGVDESGRIAPQTVAIDLIVKGALASETHLPVRTIAFLRSRNAVFQLTQRVRGALREERRSDLAEAVAPYAATFLADDRTEAEGKLRDGSTLAVVSTSALELGIDIRDLSLAVLVGYPGQISSFRQRIGRVGRAGEGLAVLIVGDDPLQQWLARDLNALQALLDGRAENVVINPDAPEIAKRFGVLPGQLELEGIAVEDAAYFGSCVRTWLEGAAGPPTATVNGRAYWRLEAPDGEAYANLRSAASGEPLTVYKVERREKSPIGTIDASSAPRDCFVPAIWTGVDGELYEVVGFDEREREIHCEGPVERPFQTRGVPVDHVAVLATHRPARTVDRCQVGYSQLQITRQVFTYKEQHFSGVEQTRQVQKGWAPVIFRTDGLHLDVDPSWIPAGEDIDGSLRALEHILLSVAPALVACDPYDLDATTQRATVFLYDSFGGGLRLSEVLYDRLPELVGLAFEVVETCPCQSGCPSCVMLARRPDGNADLSKPGVVAVLERLRSGLGG
jgi:DEAD/DEAH box helicase domain-containing protein